MQGIIITEELRKKNEREQKIVDGIIATAGGLVALGLITSIPILPAVVIGKRAMDKAKELNRDWFFDVYEWL